MNIVSITRLLDEADIVEAFVRHTSRFADHFIFIDNGSRDGTLQILSRLRAEGFDILVYQNRSVSFREVPFNTKMYLDAVRRFAADWVLCLDADEFIDDSRVEGGLVSLLKRLDGATPRQFVLRIPLYEYRRSQQDAADEMNVVLRQTRHIGSFGVTKVFLSRALASMGVTVDSGNHDALIDGRPAVSCMEPGLRLAHYTDRSHQQMMAKWIRGWAKVLATGFTTTGSGTNSHYRSPFERLRDRPEQILRDEAFISNPDGRDFTCEPLPYGGGELLYTSQTDDEMRSVRMIVGYLEELATRFGYLVEILPDASVALDILDDNFDVVVGPEMLERSEPQLPFARRTGVRKEALKGTMFRIVSWLAPAKLRTAVIARRASRAVNTGNYDEADRLLERHFTRGRRDAMLLKLYAFSAHNSGRYGQAVIRWGNARKAAPHDPMCHAGIASNLREIGAVEFAASVIGAALRLFPADATILTEASRIASRQHRFAEAAALLDRAILVQGPLANLLGEKARIASELASLTPTNVA